MLPFTHVWLPYLYLYGLGGILFSIGIIITCKSGSLDLTRKKHRDWLGVLIFGFLWFIGLHGLWILAATDVISVRMSFIIFILSFSIIGIVIKQVIRGRST